MNRRLSRDDAPSSPFRDPLTGLPSRGLFEDRLSMALVQAHRHRHRVAVVLLDLDRFKRINDSLGTSAGDELLRAVGSRLGACVREGDTVARLGGDEFGLLLPGIHYVEDLGHLAQKLTHELQAPFRVAGRDVRVTASGGISLYPEDGEGKEALLKAADTAMYRAKERGRACFQMYSPALAQKAAERQAFEESLMAALQNGEMALHYQPALALAGEHVVGFEALLRWQRPETGLVMPKEFLPLADASDVMLSLGPWVLHAACRQARAWHDAGRPDLWVAVNFSARELRQPDLARHVASALAGSGLPPRSLLVEVPEGYAMQDLDRAVATLRALKETGVRLAIDGFGAGFSSLAHLRRLPVDKLKIDLSFVRGATTDPDDAALVTAVIAVARSLGLQVTAQGVETEEQAALLRALLCDEAQGFLWSAPVPARECRRFLKAGGLAASRAPAPRKGAARRGRARG